jgi:hypothetical protein
MTQVVEHPPSKHKALISNPGITKTKQNKTKQNKKPVEETGKERVKDLKGNAEC